MTSSDKVYIHDPLYKRLTMEVNFNEDTINKLKSLNEEEGFTITGTDMQFDATGIILRLEKEIHEEEDE